MATVGTIVARSVRHEQDPRFHRLRALQVAQTAQHGSDGVIVIREDTAWRTTCSEISDSYELGRGVTALSRGAGVPATFKNQHIITK